MRLTMWGMLALALSANVVAQNQPATDPCMLVTTAEVEQVVGRMSGATTVRSSSRWCGPLAHPDQELEIWVYPAEGADEV